MMTQRKWNKGYNAIRRQLKRDYQLIRDTWGDWTDDDMYDFAWKMHLKACKLLANDGAWVYVDKAYDLAHEMYNYNEYRAAQWVVA